MSEYLNEMIGHQVRGTAEWRRQKAEQFREGSGSSLFRVGTAPGFEGGFADPSWAKRSRTPSLWRPTPAGPPGRQGI